jgi:hypothetical protein
MSTRVINSLETITLCEEAVARGEIIECEDPDDEKWEESSPEMRWADVPKLCVCLMQGRLLWKRSGVLFFGCCIQFFSWRVTTYNLSCHAVT